MNKFTEFLLTQQPQFDKEILKDFQPEDMWAGKVFTGTMDEFLWEQYVLTLNKVRKLSEGLAYKWTALRKPRSISTTSASHTFDRLHLSLPRLSGKWEPAGSMSKFLGSASDVHGSASMARRRTGRCGRRGNSTS